MSGRAEDNVIRLRPGLTRTAAAELARVLIDFDDFDADLSEHFEACLDAALEKACVRVAGEITESRQPFDAPNAEASAYWAQPMYRLKVETAKKRARGSSRGLWYVFYALRDDDGDGQVDTLRVYAIRHSAARPLSIEPADLQDTEEEI